jgi:Ca-activated chloride channel family protein
VASLLLWKHMARDLEAEAAWRRPRWDLVLALQLLVALAVAIALARPAIAGGGHPELAIVLDTSASMGSRDVQPSRLAVARQTVEDTVNSAAPNTRISLVTAGLEPQVQVENGTAANVLDALSAIQQAEPDSGDLLTAVRVAAGIVAPDAASQPPSQVVVVTDGAFNLSLPPQPVPVAFRLVGGGGQGLAVSEVSLRRPVEGGDFLAGFARVANGRADPQTTTLAILADGVLVDRAPLQVEPGSKAEATFHVPSTAQTLSIGLTERGALPAADRVDLAGYARWARRVTIVSDTPTSWEHVLSVVPNTTTRSMRPADYSAGDSSADDIYLFDNVIPSSLPAASGLILVNPPDTSTSILTRADTLPRQRRAVSFDASDPLLVGVDIAPLSVQQLERATTPSWAAASVAAEDTPLILHGRMGDQRAVIFTFDPNKSNLPHLAAFPQLMANAVDWLTPGRQAIVEGGLGARANILPRPQPDVAAASSATPPASVPQEIWPWLIGAGLVFFALEWFAAVRRG